MKLNKKQKQLISDALALQIDIAKDRFIATDIKYFKHMYDNLRHESEVIHSLLGINHG